MRPAVAVVVSTYRRASRLPRLVEALEQQVDAPPFEIVIVDDGSADDTPQVLRQLAADCAVPLRALSLWPNRGPARARNAGWRASGAPLIAFTDDDCTPAPGWLAALVEAARGADIVQGRTAPDPDQLSRRGPFSRTMDVPAMTGFFQTCNIAYRREWLERVGGFDEELRRSVEDTDLAYRALAAGATAAFRPDALVHHDVSPSSALALIRASRRWADIPLAMRKQPELTNRLHSRHFWRASHPPALLAAAGLLLACSGGSTLRRAGGLALLAPYTRFRLRRDPLPATTPADRIRLLPLAWAVDVSELAVLTAASLRYRRIVL